VEAVAARLRVVLAGITIADTTSGYRVLETSHPPTYYIPRADIRPEVLEPSARRSFCEFKGSASYWTLTCGGQRETDAAWSYEQPSAGFAEIRGMVAFYANRVEACYVDEERVQAQPGDFYGGWITSWVNGPFKGLPGSRGW
jgi:uncharacterized protein (DUF427 family)